MATRRPPPGGDERPATFVQPLPFSDACERNKGPILDVLRRWLGDTAGVVLEVGSGTGQHAVYFAKNLPQLSWQPTDQGEHLAALTARVGVEGPCNLLPPLELDVAASRWPCDVDSIDAIYSANTLHIMDWAHVKAFFRGVGRVLRADGLLLIYGPFRYGGQYTSHSNHAFDDALRRRDPDSGIRDFEAVDALAVAQGLTLVDDVAMPANNQTLVWRKTAG